MKVSQALNAGQLNLQNAITDSDAQQSVPKATASEQVIVSVFSAVLPDLDPQFLQSFMRGIAQFGELGPGVPDSSALETLISLPSAATTLSSQQSASTVYSSVPNVAEYSFVIHPPSGTKAPDSGPTGAPSAPAPPERLTIDGMPIEWLPKQLPDGSWGSVSELLIPQNLYEAWFPTSSISWKIKTSTKPATSAQDIPPSSKISKVMFNVVKNSLAILQKISLVLTTLSITQDELAFFRRHPKEFWKLDFRSITLDQLNSLAVYADLRDSSGTQQCANTILEVWKYAFRSSGSTPKDKKKYQ